MKLTGVTPNLISDDLPRALAFYRDVLGFSVRHDRARRRAVRLHHART